MGLTLSLVSVRLVILAHNVKQTLMNATQIHVEMEVIAQISLMGFSACVRSDTLE